MKKLLILAILAAPASAVWAEGEMAAPVSPVAEAASPVSPAVKAEVPVVATAAAKVETAPVTKKAVTAATEPKARMKQAIDIFLTIHTAEDGKKLDKAAKEANAAAFKTLDGFLNWDAMTTYILEPHLESLTKKQAEEVAEIFSEAVRLVAYPASGTFFRTSDWKISKVEGNDVSTQAYFEDEDLEVNSTFHMKEHDGVLKIWDLSVDGDSMAKDYQNSFGRIISKHGGADLVERLKKARAEKEEAVKDMLP